MSDETWAYDYNTDAWEQMNPPAHPDARMSLGAAYDAATDRVIIYGGHVGSVVHRDDTWAYDYDTDTWTQLTPATNPGARGTHSMAADTESGRVIVFGGRFVAPR